MVELGGAGGLHEGGVVELLRLAAALLPDQEALVPLPHILDLGRHEIERLVPGGLAPLPRPSLGVRPNERRLHPVGVVDRHDLGNALGAELPPVPRVRRVPLELDHPPVDLAGEHPAVLLADPTGGGDPFLLAGFRALYRARHQGLGAAREERRQRAPSRQTGRSLEKTPPVHFHRSSPKGDSIGPSANSISRGLHPLNRVISARVFERSSASILRFSSSQKS